MKPGLDHQSHMLGIRGWQRAAPLTLDDFEHIRIAHAAEALAENFFGDRISAGRQHLGVGSVDDRLAVDQHPIAVENDQLKSAGNPSEPLDGNTDAQRISQHSTALFASASARRRTWSPPRPPLAASPPSQAEPGGDF
jgi:hypothetical protein